MLGVVLGLMLQKRNILHITHYLSEQYAAYTSRSGCLAGVSIHLTSSSLWVIC